MDLGDPCRLEHPDRPPEGEIVLARKPDDHVGRQVEVFESLQPAQVGRARVPARHCPEDAVVARLERHMQVTREGWRLPKRCHELVVDVVDLDRRQAQAGEAWDRTGLADEAGEREARLAVAVAAQVDPGQHDLAMALRDAPPDLGEDRSGAPAPRSTPDERDDTEVAREAAAVLDLDEGADAIKPGVRADTADRAHVAG